MSPSEIKNQQLKDLDDKLNEIRKKKNLNKNSNGQAFKSAHIGWRMILELVIGILIGVLLGFGMDYLFNTTPIFLIIMIFFGFAAGVKTMMKTAKEIKVDNRIRTVLECTLCGVTTYVKAGIDQTQRMQLNAPARLVRHTIS